MRLRVVCSSVSILLLLALTACGTATTAAQGDQSVSSKQTDKGSAGTSGGAEERAADEAQTEDARSASKPNGSGGDAVVPALLDFSSRTVDGASFSGADLAGRPAVLWFWAPWCPTCRGQIDDVTAAAEQYGGDVAFVGVGSLDSGAAIADFAGDVPAQQVTQLSDPDGSVWRQFGITEQSTYVILDANGQTVTSGYLDEGELLDVAGDLAGR